MALTIADIQIILGANIVGFQNSMNGVQASLGNVRTAIMTTAALVDKHLSQPIIAFGKNALKAGMEFEKTMVEIAAITGLADDRIGELSETAKELSKNTLFSTNEAAQGMLELLKAGMSTKQVAGELKGTMDLAAAGSINLADAAILVANSLNAFKDDGLNATKVANILAGAANASTADVHSLRLGMSQVSAVAAVMGMKMEDTAAGLAVFANNSLRGSDAGTSFKTMLLNLQPTTKKQIELSNKLGLVTAEGTSKFFDQNHKIKDLAGIADTLQTALAGMNEEQRIAAVRTLFGTDAIRAASIIAKEGAEGVRKLKREMADVSAEEIAKKMTESLSAQLLMLKNDVDRAGISIYEMVSGPIVFMVEKLRILINWFEQTDESTKGIIISIALLLAAIGPAIFFVGQLGLALEALAIIGGLQAGWMLRFAKALFPAMVRVTILGGMIYLLTAYWDKFTNEVKYAVERLGTGLVPVLIQVIGVMGALGALLLGMSPKWALIAGLAAAFAALAYIVATNWNAVVKILQGIAQLIGYAFQALYYDIQKSMIGIILIVYNAFNKMLDIMQKGVDYAGSLGGKMADMANGFYAARRSIYAFGSQLNNSMQLAQGSLSGVNYAIDAAKAGISQSWGALTQNVIDKVSSIVASVKNIGAVVTPNLDDYKNALAKTSEEAAKLTSNVDETSDSMKDFTESTTKALTAVEYFDHQIKILSTQLEIFKLKNNLADESVEYLGKSIETFTAQQKIAALKVADLTNQLNNLIKTGKNNTREFLETEDALYDAKLQYEKFGQAIEDAGKKARESNSDWVRVTDHVSRLAKTVKEAAKVTQGSNFGTVATTLGQSAQNIVDLSKGTSGGAASILSGEGGINYPSVASTGTNTPNDSVSTTPQATYSPVVVQNLYVRKESDIEEIAKELFKLQQNQLRARGVTP
jgi:TP901 family phage tail tape measure protein